MCPPADRPRRPCLIPLEKRRAGGRTAAAKLTREQRQAGGRARCRCPDFVELQRRRGRKGATVTLERHGPQKLAEILAAYYREHPTSLERFVHRVLCQLGVPFETQRVVEVVYDQTYWRLDVVLPGGGAGGADLVIEPGAAFWHDPVRDAARAAILVRLGYPYLLTLSDTAIEQTPAAAAQQIVDFIRRPGSTDPVAEGSSADGYAVLMAGASLSAGA